MRFEHLYYLAVLSQHKSLNAASEQLHITQQTLSSALKNMEKKFNTTLFTRTPQGVYLTVDGEIFMETVTDILDKLEQFTVKYAPLEQQSLSGNITLYCNWSAHHMIIPHILTNQYMNHPNLTVDVNPVKTKSVLKSCIEHSESFGLILCPPKSLTEDSLLSELILQPLSSYPVVVLTHPESPLAELSQISLSELGDQKLVLFENDYEGEFFLSKLVKKYTDAKTLLTKNYNLCNQMVHDQLALTLTVDTNPSSRQEASGLIKIPLAEQFQINVYLVFSPENKSEEKIHSLNALLKEMPSKEVFNHENNAARIPGSSI